MFQLATFPLFSRLQRKLRGHFRIGNRITIYGNNAMHWAVNIYTKRWGYVCFRIPFLSRRQFYFYVSPNATRWACTYYIGGDKTEKVRAMARRQNFGHNFNTDECWGANSAICSKFDQLWITEHDVQIFGDKPEAE